MRSDRSPQRLRGLSECCYACHKQRAGPPVSVG